MMPNFLDESNRSLIVILILLLLLFFTLGTYDREGDEKLLSLLLMPFIGHKIRGAANAPSQLLHGKSYPRTGTFSVVS